MPFVTTPDGTNLHYMDVGSGRPIVLIHGWPLSATMWEHQIPTLTANGFRCIAYDRRGFGKSDQPWIGYNYDTFADDLACVLDTLKIQDATLIGFSMGGGEIARYFARHGGKRVRSCALVASVTPCMMKAEDNPAGVERSVFDGMIAQLQNDRPAFLAAFIKQFFGVGLLNFSVSGEMLEWTRMVALQASPKATTECVRAFSETDFRPDMPKISVPALVIHGDADKTVPIDASGKPSARMIEGSTSLIYQGAPHGLFFTHADRLNDDLVKFCAK